LQLRSCVLGPAQRIFAEGDAARMLAITRSCVIALIGPKDGLDRLLSERNSISTERGCEVSAQLVQTITKIVSFKPFLSLADDRGGPEFLTVCRRLNAEQPQCCGEEQLKAV